MVENILLLSISPIIQHCKDLKRAYEGKKVSLLFVCNVRLISKKLLMVEDGVALMKLLKM
jgi:hypothetical protein